MPYVTKVSQMSFEAVLTVFEHITVRLFVQFWAMQCRKSARDRVRQQSPIYLGIFIVTAQRLPKGKRGNTSPLLGTLGPYNNEPITAADFMLPLVGIDSAPSERASRRG